jgi:hypothetical protein
VYEPNKWRFNAMINAKKDQESASCLDEYKTGTAHNLARPIFHHIEAEPEIETVLANSHDL